MKKHHNFKFNSLVLIGWFIAMILIMLQNSAVVNYVNNLEKLHLKVTELKHIVTLSDPFRSQQVSRQEKTTNEIKQLKEKIEEQFASHLFIPDSTQLLHVAGQFLQAETDYMSMENKLLAFVARFEQQKKQANGSDNLSAFYDQLGSQFFDAFFSPTPNNDSYILFDRLLLRADQLPADDAKQLQTLLADASTLLSQYSQVSYYVNKLQATPLFEQLNMVREELYDSQRWLFLLSCMVSFLSLLLVATYHQPQPELTHQQNEAGKTNKAINEHELETLILEQENKQVVPDDKSVTIKKTLTDDESFHFHSTPVSAKSDLSTPDLTTTEKANETSVMKEQDKFVNSENIEANKSTSSHTHFEKSAPVRNSSPVFSFDISDHQEIKEEVIAVPTAMANLDAKAKRPDTKVDNKSQELVSEPAKAKGSTSELLTSGSAIFDVDNMIDTLGGDLESVEMLLDVFLQDHSEDADKLTQSLKEGDKEVSIRIAHSLKGVAGTLGADQLRDVAAKLELKIKHDEEIVESEIKQFDDAIVSVVKEVNQYLANSKA